MTRLTQHLNLGSGRGHTFARAAYPGVGTRDWSDVNGMVDEAVKRGLADKDKVCCHGSVGGSLTFSFTIPACNWRVESRGILDSLGCESNEE